MKWLDQKVKDMCYLIMLTYKPENTYEVQYTTKGYWEFKDDNHKQWVIYLDSGSSLWYTDVEFKYGTVSRRRAWEFVDKSDFNLFEYPNYDIKTFNTIIKMWLFTVRSKLVDEIKIIKLQPQPGDYPSYYFHIVMVEYFLPENMEITHDEVDKIIVSVKTT